MIEDSEYWKTHYEKAMNELEKTQALLIEMSHKLRELEANLFGGPTK
jgi:hypothetical protein